MMLPQSKKIPFDAETNPKPVIRNSEIDSSAASTIDEAVAVAHHQQQQQQHDKRILSLTGTILMDINRFSSTTVVSRSRTTLAIPIASKKRSVTFITATRMRIFLFITLIILLALTIYVHANWRPGQPRWSVSQMSDQSEKLICQMTNQTLFKEILKPLLVPRIYITRSVENAGFAVEYDSFVEFTPHGNKQFKNIIATFDPSAPRRFVLACHYESKIFPGANFIGATDSAVPCAMLLDIARTLGPYLSNRRNKDVTLQLLFLDGEEAFSEWTATDSLYGARHLSRKWHEMPFTNPIDPRSTMKSELDRIHLPHIFVSGLSWAAVEDDHVPFRRRGVPILHIIPVPFPDVWHQLSDNESALHYPTIDNIVSIMRVFTAKYLNVLP
ncbi:unnamed protein product [Anisakis simplex]|uniref:glutaminyl-peptide cyclotransferase n=1 Tax=Anisakis simplex TaxID=6269 RepID=A0A0M3K5H3_ANISI|nr:unnamed protein product [Anisakis simplex]